MRYKEWSMNLGEIDFMVIGGDYYENMAVKLYETENMLADGIEYKKM